MIRNLIAIMMLGLLGLTSCSDSKSYAELLEDENKSVNRYLADQRVITRIPADTVFECGPDAPYYQLDPDGNLFMQVINPGSGPKATTNQLIYFRFMRYNLSYYGIDEELSGEGNAENIEYGNTSFRFQNYSLTSSSQWGTGIQTPLLYLPLNCEVKIVVKSQYGFTEEISYVQPFLYHIRYYKSQI